MSASIWVTNPSKTAETRFMMTWDLQDRIVLYLPSGEEVIWSIKTDKPVFEALDGRISIRCNSRRLYASDSISEQTLKIWQKKFFDQEETTEVESEPIDVAKYARLLADGLISLDDFNLLTKQSETSSTSNNTPNEPDPLYEEYLNSLEAAWPGLIKVEIDLLGRITSSGAPKDVNMEFVKSRLEMDKREFQRTINNPDGLVNLYISMGKGLQFKGMPKGFINQALQAGAGMPALTKIFAKEIRRGSHSDETHTLILRYKTHFQSRQSRLKSFAIKVGWKDLPFL